MTNSIKCLLYTRQNDDELQDFLTPKHVNKSNTTHMNAHKELPDQNTTLPSELSSSLISGVELGPNDSGILWRSHESSKEHRCSICATAEETFQIEIVLHILIDFGSLLLQFSFIRSCCGISGSDCIISMAR